MFVTRQDRPLFVALIALALALGLNAAVSFAESQYQKGHASTDKDPYEIPKLVLEALEALATVSIAGYAVAEYAHSRKRRRA